MLGSLIFKTSEHWQGKMNFTLLLKANIVQHEVGGFVDRVLGHFMSPPLWEV